MAGSSRKAIYAALIGDSLIAVTKFIAAALTESAAMLSEGIYAAVDTGNQVLLLLGLRRAGRPASAGFPFGHGKDPTLRRVFIEAERLLDHQREIDAAGFRL